MKSETSKIRIKDIASMAGVSEGTVDRVLHNRGEVSAKSRELVTKVLEEINYSPNLLARSLASKKKYRFVCLFPAHHSAEYWESVDNGFDLAALDYLHYNVNIEKRYFNQFDANSFIEVSNQIIESNPDAVFIAPVFKDEALSFMHKLMNLKIPFSFIDSVIDDASFLTYYGQNSFKSGYIAAKLLLSSLPEHSQVMVIRTKRIGTIANQTIARNNGFMHYIKENELSDKFDLINVEFSDTDENANLEILREIFRTYNNIKAAITFNSKVFRLAKYLDILNHTDVRLIGYDLLEQNVAYLKQGVISYLIAQRPEKQAYYSVRDMCRKLIFEQEIKKINYVPIDILMKENIEDYMHFRE